MTEDRKIKKIDRIIEDLYSPSDMKVMGALKNLREKGNEKAIPALIDVLISTKSDNIYSETTNILHQLKVTKAKEPLIKAIQDPKTKGHKQVLIATFWEAGIDASEHLSLFVDTALEEDYLTCLECLTVIENLNGPFKDEVVFAEIKKIKEEMQFRKTEKDDLLQSIIEVLNSMVIGE